jgi:hypothetical protein
VKAFSSFYDALLPELPGCTTVLLDYHLRQVARDFCDRTGCWVDTFPTIQMAANTVSYFVLTQEPKTQLVRLLRMTINGRLQWSAFETDDCDLEQRVDTGACDTEQPRFAPQHPPFTLDYNRELLTLKEQPDGDIVLVGSMKPTLAVTTLPDLLLNVHLEAVRTGVLSRLMVMPRKPWTDRALAVDYRSAYERDVQAAKTQTQNGNTRKPLRTRQWG